MVYPATGWMTVAFVAFFDWWAELPLELGAAAVAGFDDVAGCRAPPAEL